MKVRFLILILLATIILIPSCVSHKRSAAYKYQTQILKSSAKKKDRTYNRKGSSKKYRCHANDLNQIKNFKK